MADLIGFDQYLNTTTPFDPKEHRAVWKSNQTYLDFGFQNSPKDTCEYPRFWNESGNLVLKGSDSLFDQLVGCYDSEFDQVRTQTGGGAWFRGLTPCSTAISKPLAITPTGSDSLQSSHLCKIVSANGTLQCARKSTTSHA